MKIAEIFPSIAGEGSWMGRVAVFVRFSGCNLNCEWCDEKHARNGVNMSVEEVVRKVRGYANVRRVVITGGEPLLQKSECIELVRELDDYRIMIETNGTMLNKLHSDEKSVLRSCEITVSPKKGKISGNAVRAAISLSCQFKFVVGNAEGAWKVEEVREFVEKYGICKEDVWLMPLSTGGEIDDKLAREIWESCVKNGYNYSDRLHIRVWKGERGR